MKAVLHNIAANEGFSIKNSQPLSGGDINEVFLLKCDQGDLVYKLNSASKFPRMFEAEAKGLELLSQSGSFKIPTVFAEGAIDDIAYLLLEYIPSGKPNEKFWEVFAENLATLHKTTSDQFGLDHDNYIGSLQQKNRTENSASQFYINQRLRPQFEIASEKGYNFSKSEKFFKNISEEILNEKPSLIHGDLWSGNYLVSEKNEAVLIDPAVSYGLREMDLAMMRLFGGFPEEVFNRYNDLFPLEKNFLERTKIFQLYYLLVHLNLFGSSYLDRVQQIYKRFL